MRGIGLVTKMVVPVGIVFIIILTALFSGPAFWLGALFALFMCLSLPNLLYLLVVVLGVAFVISLGFFILKWLGREDIEFAQKLVAVMGVAFVVSSAAFIGAYRLGVYQQQQCGGVELFTLIRWSPGVRLIAGIYRVLS